jgi:hypothetical protein
MIAATETHTNSNPAILNRPIKSRGERFNAFADVNFQIAEITATRQGADCFS